MFNKPNQNSPCPYLTNLSIELTLFLLEFPIPLLYAFFR